MYLSALLLVVALTFTALYAAPHRARLVKRAVSAAGSPATRACAQQETACLVFQFYNNQPLKGYTEELGCRAMKAAYQCIVQANCSDQKTLDVYNGWIQGYESNCPNTTTTSPDTTAISPDKTTISPDKTTSPATGPTKL